MKEILDKVLPSGAISSVTENIAEQQAAIRTMLQHQYSITIHHINYIAGVSIAGCSSYYIRRMCAAVIHCYNEILTKINYVLISIVCPSVFFLRFSFSSSVDLY